VDLDVAAGMAGGPSGETSRLHLGFFDQQLASPGRKKRTEENLDRVKRAVELGYMTRIDLAAADAALQKMHTQLTTEQQREEERLALNQSLGFSDDQTRPIGTEYQPPSPKVYRRRTIHRSIEKRRLDLLALEYGYRGQEAVKSGNPPTVPEDNIGFSRRG